MFGSLGFTEIAFILVLALLLFGPKRLPEIGRTIGKGLAEFRRASNDLRRTLENEVALDEVNDKRRPTPTPAWPQVVEPVKREPPPIGDAAVEAPPAGETAGGEGESSSEPAPTTAPPAPGPVERAD